MNDKLEIRRAIMQLEGLPLASIRRIADMLVLHFGTMRTSSRVDLPSLQNKPLGSCGDIALHVQCPWRIENDIEIITGRSDLWKPLRSQEHTLDTNWDHERDGNLQDEQIQRFEAIQRTHHVENVCILTNGSISLDFDTGYRLIVFPSGSVGEDWRIFRSDTDRPHLVVSGGKIECHDS